MSRKKINVSVLLPRSSALEPDVLPPEYVESAVQDCISDECLEAKARLPDARNSIRQLCTRIAAKTNERNAAGAVAAALLAGSAALFAAASVLLEVPIIGRFLAFAVALVAAILLIFALVAAMVALVFQLELNGLEGQLAAAQNQWDYLVDEVMRNCSELCWDDLDVPQCD